ncbi:Hsp20/alpha crystallin family protein [Dysgonomonas sp. Marseille-P4361]|uniref:Hsp20/alpha crystallin family protein n=1 Tax=Dysgonomonas sp. Marseille-P4361 TaxID=2161820 RepID=UPI000D55900E|nr:Hsp20/alpha crystallin family protein [Dysgonomonas sp. Marseille-P4361]
MKNQLRKFDRSGRFFPTFFNHYFNDDLFNNFFEGDLPATNVTETDKAFNIEVSIPGFNKEDIKIAIEKNILNISAHTEVENEEKGENEKILRREFKKSSFERIFTIPDNIDTENIEAAQKDGILSISLPKKDKAIEDKVKTIEIK